MMKLTHLMVAMMCATAAMASVAAGIRTVTVEAHGVGANRDEAMKAAQAEAVARVNGLSLDSRDVTRVKAEVSNKSESKNGESSSDTKANMREYQERQTTTATQGSVKSFQVLSENCEAGKCEVRLSVDVNKYEAGQQTQRARIAVLDFRRKGGGQGTFADQLNQAMVNYLTSTRHFAVLDRTYEKERLAELKGLTRDDVLTEERARIGNSLGTDYIVVGSAEEFSQQRLTTKVPYTNEIVHQQEVNVVVSWRTIEAATGQVMVSNTIAKKVTYNLNDADQGAVGRDIGTAIAEAITDVIYPIPVLSYQEPTKSVVIGQGGSTLKEGKEYRLVKYGPLLTNPYTGETSSREEIEVGQVRVTRVTPKSAYAEVLKTTVDLRQAVAREYILRPMSAADDQGAKSKPKKTMQPAW